MMMPPALEKRILVSAPKSVSFNGDTYSVAVEKARFAEIERMLKVCPIAVTINIFGDRDRGRGHTPTNMFNRQYNEEIGAIYYEYIMRMAATLSVNLHVAECDEHDYGSLIENAVRSYLAWSMWELRDTNVEVIGQVGPVSDFTFLERGIIRQHFDIPIMYQFTMPLRKAGELIFVNGQVIIDTEEDGPFWSANVSPYAIH